MVKKSLAKLGGYLINNWQNDCAFVVMNSITTTVKVIDALLCQKLIITKTYLEDLVQFCETINENLKAKFPNPADYLPEIEEFQLKNDQISFDPCEERIRLFHNKTFIFFNDQQVIFS